MYVVLQFSVLHQQINCCFILVHANNQNIIMELVAHGGMIFYNVHTGRHTNTHCHLIHPCTQVQAGTKPSPRYTTCVLTQTHSHPHKARVLCSLMPPVELSLDFVSLLSCISFGSDGRWARLWRSARSEGDESWPPSLGSCSLKPRP